MDGGAVVHPLFCLVEVHISRQRLRQVDDVTFDLAVCINLKQTDGRGEFTAIGEMWGPRVEKYLLPNPHVDRLVQVTEDDDISHRELSTQPGGHPGDVIGAVFDVAEVPGEVLPQASVTVGEEHSDTEKIQFEVIVKRLPGKGVH